MAVKPISIPKISQKCDDVSALLRILSHPQRLMIMGHLSHGAKTVSELQELCTISQSQISQFLSRLKLEGLLDSRREGRFQYYFIADKKIVRLIQAIQEIYC